MQLDRVPRKQPLIKVVPAGMLLGNPTNARSWSALVFAVLGACPSHSRCLVHLRNATHTCTDLETHRMERFGHSYLDRIVLPIR